MRDVANHLVQFQPLVMGTGERRGFGSHVVVERTYVGRGGFAPQMRQNLRPLWRLVRGGDEAVWHFVFAPNPRSCQAIRALRRLRSRPTIQTIASPPRTFDGIDELLFGDVVVAQSEWTAEQVQRASTRGTRVEVIRPPLALQPAPPAEVVQALRRKLEIEPSRDIVTYPGDLEFSGGAERVADLVSPLLAAHPKAVVVFACRQKTESAAQVLHRLAARLDPTQVRFAGELPSLPALLAASKLVVFPVTQLFAKVDIPIALLEAMSLGVPVVVPTEGPVAELSSAYRVPLQDNAGWLRACTELLTVAPMWEMIQTRQRAQVQGEFAAKVVAGRYEDLYQRVLGKA